MTHGEFLYREATHAIARQRFKANSLPSFGFYREGEAFFLPPPFFFEERNHDQRRDNLHT